MLDLKFVCENIETVKAAMAKRSGTYPVDEIGQLAAKRKELIKAVEKLKAEKNAASAQVAMLKKNKQDATAIIEEMKQKGEEIKKLDDELDQILAQLKELMLRIPNITHESVPFGKDSDDNVEVRRIGTPPSPGFELKSHWDIGEKLGLFNWDQAAKITGSRFTVYHGLGARLERAVVNLMLDTHTENGYEEIFPPFMVNRDSMIGTGQLPKFEEDMYAVKGTDFYMVPTAEVPVTNLFRNDVLEKKNLPVWYCAYTACFRGEAGSAGRDTRGLIRQHQFNKVELVKFTEPSKGYEELEQLTCEAELILKKLGIAYRVVTLCTGDTGFGSAKTYDIEVWMPSYGRYVEISSCSCYEDFQARRANIRYKDDDGKLKFVYTLNGSGLAVGRTVAAIIENYQNQDGTVTVPEALRKYMGVDVIK